MFAYILVVIIDNLLQVIRSKKMSCIHGKCIISISCSNEHVFGYIFIIFYLSLKRDANQEIKREEKEIAIKLRIQNSFLHKCLEKNAKFLSFQDQKRLLIVANNLPTPSPQIQLYCLIIEDLGLLAYHRMQSDLYLLDKKVPNWKKDKLANG